MPAKRQPRPQGRKGPGRNRARNWSERLNVAELRPVVNRLESIDDLAKNVSSNFSVIRSRMRLCFVPRESSRSHRAREHSLTKRYTAKRRCVEATKCMKRISLDLGSLDRLIQKRKIKGRIVPDQYGSAAVVLSHRSAYRPEDSL